MTETSSNAGGGDDRATRLWPLILGMCIGLVVMTCLWGFLGYVLPLLLHPNAAPNGCGASQPAAHELRGTFGDQFGAVNALFSGLALVGVVFALLLQRREVKQAIEEHRDAARQHAAVVRTEILLRVVDDIRSQEWGNAHAALARWRREHGTNFVTAFIEDRGDNPAESKIDQSRRVFIRPIYKVWHLYTAGIIDRDFAAQVLSADIAESVHHILAPLTEAIYKQINRVEAWPTEDQKLFKFVESLHEKGADPYSTGEDPR